MLLPVSYLLMSLSSEAKNISANQISSTYLNSRLRYNYLILQFSKNKRPPYWNSTYGFEISIIPPHNRYVILHHAAQFHPNWTTNAETWRHINFQNGGRGASILLTVSYLLMSTAFRRSKSTSKPNFVDISQYYSWLRYNYFRLGFRPFHSNQVVILHQAAEFRPNRTSVRYGKWRHVDFQDGSRQPCCICFGVTADHLQSAFRGLNSLLKSLVRPINNYGDIAMNRFCHLGLKSAYSRPLKNGSR